MNIDNEIIKKRLIEIYSAAGKQNGFPQDFIDAKFHFPVYNPKDVLLVGLNPSLSDIGETIDGWYPPYELQKNAKHHMHFKRFFEIMNNTPYGDNWCYHDVFYFRETNSKEMYNYFRNDGFLTFLWEQLLLSIDIIESIHPKLIVVCNSQAANFFGINAKGNDNVWMGYKFTFNEELGCYNISGNHKNYIDEKGKETPLLNTPVLFYSTLTYMDDFNRERLSWQIRRILNNK
jgi:hypothetical protein